MFYTLQVIEDPKNGLFSRHSVGATVNVTVKEIPEEAVDKSGSIRFEGVTAEDFVTRDAVRLFSDILCSYYDFGVCSDCVLNLARCIAEGRKQGGYSAVAAGGRAQ